jgi:hypothetical protein
MHQAKHQWGKNLSVENSFSKVYITLELSQQWMTEM